MHIDFALLFDLPSFILLYLCEHLNISTVLPVVNLTSLDTRRMSTIENWGNSSLSTPVTALSPPCQKKTMSSVVYPSVSRWNQGRGKRARVHRCWLLTYTPDFSASTHSPARGYDCTWAGKTFRNIAIKAKCERWLCESCSCMSGKKLINEIL